MCWSRRGAHRLIQVRVAALEGGLQDVFRRWYSRFPMPVGREATRTPRFFPLPIETVGYDACFNLR
jgi:hypothetical protein